MRLRTANPADVPRLVELVRANATAAQWTEEQFTKMIDDGQRVVLVFEVEASAESGGAAGEKQIPRFARNDNPVNDNPVNDNPVRDNPVREESDRSRHSEGMRVEGFAVANRIGRECEIENIVVNPRRQRCGLGQNLLTELLDHVRRKECDAVFLEVRESNRAARGLYEKCGFREVGRRVKYYAQPQEDAVVYRFSIDPIAS